LLRRFFFFLVIDHGHDVLPPSRIFGCTRDTAFLSLFLPYGAARQRVIEVFPFSFFQGKGSQPPHTIHPFTGTENFPSPPLFFWGGIGLRNGAGWPPHTPPLFFFFFLSFLSRNEQPAACYRSQTLPLPLRDVSSTFSPPFPLWGSKRRRKDPSFPWPVDGKIGPNPFRLHDLWRARQSFLLPVLFFFTSGMARARSPL